MSLVLISAMDLQSRIDYEDTNRVTSALTLLLRQDNRKGI